jgi:hypothetical protein
MSKRNESKEQMDWGEASLPSISADARQAAYETIPDSMWQNFAAFPLVAITVRSPMIIGGGDDPLELSDLDSRFGVAEVDYFIAPSKLYKGPSRRSA